ncbi:M949_RS01915 family surface polysaccharide biosynthesis protein [Duganella violaceipulchra]|uniref:VCBS repeat-containing protein n=1 Tax=Duganella violaceipulchra TaxID=2849652 RepID=A0AA41H8X1_9BURK|nr:hypothetical protein [Duganella violaceicalia]MBV6319328.1 hypothetical protein [Duganella violaceicalia]MCP2006861.1 hypothetical protein [Duganella violaceicalia]
MKTVSITFLSAGMLLCMSTACSARAPTPDNQPADLAYLTTQHIPSAGNLVMARRVRDKEGEHVLVLNRKAGPSPAKPKSGRVEHIELDVGYYSRQGSAWKAEWSLHDFVDCPGLDSVAEFFVPNVGITDLNGDGKAEVTIPYKLFCGGGVDSYTVKVILREGTLKLAIRGDSLVKLPGQEPFGGEHQYDKTLLAPTYALYKQHMDKVWDAVSIDVRK